MSTASPEAPPHFIRHRIAEDLAAGRCRQVVTRFPPEPNGYLHIGHAKAALLSWQMAREHGGVFRLRFDDTNPEKESAEFESSIVRDLRWLGCSWEGEPRYTSDYFPQLYQYARQLVHQGDAYVCELSAEQIRNSRGTLTEAGQNSPYRDRPAEESLRLLEEMRTGAHPDGSYVLRAKIDMAAPNIHLRDPVLYRIRHIAHYRSGERWRIYPTYDFSHCLSDAIEGVSHSLCTLEFENNRPLYDWLLQRCGVESAPQQIEFARLNLSAMVLSKRHLKTLVEEGCLSGWDDPRLPTLSALRRRGYPPQALHEFCTRIGISRADNLVDVAMLEHCVRETLEQDALRALCVLRPLRVVLHGLPSELQQRELQLPAHPERPEAGHRSLRLGTEIFIERDDYADSPPPGWRRLSPGQAVRLRGACVIRCEEVERDDRGEPLCLHCRCDADSFGVKPDYKIGGVIHWVPADTAVPVEVRLYERLFVEEQPLPDDSGLPTLNPDSLQSLSGCLGEASLAGLEVGTVRQFERLGYFCVDPDSRPGQPVFNRTAALRDSWGKRQKKNSRTAQKPAD